MSCNQNILLSWGFPTDAATATATSAAANMPVTHLQNQQPSVPWRSTGCASETVTFDLGIAAPMKLLYLGNHNLTTQAVVTVEFSADNFSTIAKTYTFNITSPYVLGLGLEPLGVCTLGSTDACNDIPGTYLRNFFLLDGTDSYRYVRVRFVDPLNSDGYIQAGRVILGNYWQPRFNISFGYNQAPLANLENKFSMSFSYLDAGEASQLNIMIRQVGQIVGNGGVSRAGSTYARGTKNILFVAFPTQSDVEHIQNLGLCFLESQGGFTRVDPKHREFSLVLREAL
jgi:hypothetical protein